MEMTFAGKELSTIQLHIVVFGSPGRYRAEVIFGSDPKNFINNGEDKATPVEALRSLLQRTCHAVEGQLTRARSSDGLESGSEPLVFSLRLLVGM